MKITLAKAFKERSRLNRKIHDALELVRDENSIVEGGVRSIDVRRKFAEVKALGTKMILLKQAINRANAGIADKLVEIVELKELRSRLMAIPAHDGRQKTFPEEYVLTAEIKKAELIAEAERLQNRIDELQDEIDDFNARTRIEFEL